MRGGREGRGRRGADDAAVVSAGSGGGAGGPGAGRAAGHGDHPERGVVDELVALHEELGVLPALGAVPTTRTRKGVPDALLLRTLATLPFVDGAALCAAAETLFKEPAILPRLGWAGLGAGASAGGNDRGCAGIRRDGSRSRCRATLTRCAPRRGGWPRRPGRRCSARACRRCLPASWWGPRLRRGGQRDRAGPARGGAGLCLGTAAAAGGLAAAGGRRLRERQGGLRDPRLGGAGALGGTGCMRLLLADALG